MIETLTRSRVHAPIVLDFEEALVLDTERHLGEQQFLFYHPYTVDDLLVWFYAEAGPKGQHRLSVSVYDETGNVVEVQRDARFRKFWWTHSMKGSQRYISERDVREILEDIRLAAKS